MQHQDSKHNNANIRFEWTPESLEQIKTVVARYPPQYKKAAVMPVLDIAQRQNGGWVSLSAMNEVARTLEMPPMRVYEVSSDSTFVMSASTSAADRSLPQRSGWRCSNDEADGLNDGAATQWTAKS